MISEARYYERLALEVIKLATKDILLSSTKMQDRESALTFMNSEWFYALAEFIGIDPDWYKEKVLKEQLKKRVAL